MLNNGRPLVIAAGLLLLIVVGVIVSIMLLSGDDGKKTTAEVVPAETPAPETPGSGPAEQALARYVQTTLGKGFVEDCAKAQPGQDAGKICSTFRQERNNYRAYILGLVASEPSQWAIVQNQGGNWNVVHTPAITRDTSAVAGIPWPIVTGAELVVTGAAPCVNVREGPSTNTRAVDCLNDGTRVRLIAGPVAADNYQWWQVQGRSGWIVSDYLRYPE